MLRRASKHRRGVPPRDVVRIGERAMVDVSTYLPGILLAYSAFFLAIASPGPNVLAVIGTSMAVGRGSGIALALGVASGSFLWALLTAFGLTALITSFA